MISEGKPGHGQHVACIQSGNLTRTNMKLRGIRDTCKSMLAQMLLSKKSPDSAFATEGRMAKQPGEHLQALRNPKSYCGDVAQAKQLSL